MRRLWCFLLIFPLLSWGNPSSWEARSEEEALFLRRIADFWQEGEYQIAKSQMEEFLAAYPDSPFSSSLCAALGDLLLREKNYSAALNYYSKIASPELSSQIFLNRMQCLYHIEWYATLADECEAFLKKEDLESSQKLQTTYYLAIALYQQCLNASKDPDALVKLAERAHPYFEMLFQTELNNEVAAAFAHLSCILKDYPKASSIYLDLAKNNPEEEEEMLFQSALIQAEYDKGLAAKAFEQIARKGQGKSKEAAYNQLLLSFDAGEYEHILSEKDALLHQIPQDRVGMAHLLLGRSFLAVKKYPEATEQFKAYLSDAPPGETLHSALVSLIDSSFRSDDLVSLDLALTQLTASFPNDAETLRGRFSRALMLKKGQQVSEAKRELETLLEAYPQFSEAPQAAFELTHLDYQAKAWGPCRDKARSFVSKFPDHDLTPYAWRYLISSSYEISVAKPDVKELKEQLAFDLETLLRQRLLLSPQEKCGWQFLLAKTNFELGCYEEAMSILQPLRESKLPFPQEANAYLLTALCYRDGLGDLENFYSFAAQAIEKKADLIDLSSLHASLFNACLELSQNNEKWMEKAADHLFIAFEQKAKIQPENILWLANHFYSRIEKLEERGPIAVSFIETSASLFEKILDVYRIPKEDPLVVESIFCKLGKLYQLLGKKDEAIDLLQKLIAQQKESSSLPWKCETEASLLLAESYAAIGKNEEAIALFDSIVKEKSTLRTLFGASASLQSARLRLAQSMKENVAPTDPRIIQILSQLKDIALQKTLANEPLHLEAALDYIDLQSQFDQAPEKKRLSLLIKTKEGFETTADILSKDYHEARVRFPRKNQIFQGYLHLIEADILDTQAALSEGPDEQKELQAKAKGLLLQIVDEKAHPYLVTRALKRLKNVPIFEQKT